MFCGFLYVFNASLTSKKLQQQTNWLTDAMLAMLAEPAGEASPRDADRIMSGYWGVVAIWVTHPLCPFRVPLTVICSVILATFGAAFYKDGFGFSEVQENLGPHRIWAQRKRKFRPGC